MNLHLDQAAKVCYCSVLIVAGVMAVCFRQPAVPNATPDIKFPGPYTDGSVLKYKCNFGYKEYGTNTAYKCRANSWVDGDYECKLKYCNQIYPPEHGRITNSPNFTAGSSVMFRCNTGYEMSGVSTLICEDGQWIPASPPTCIVKTCPDFGSIADATIYFQAVTDGVKNDYESVVRITCNPNFVLVGKNQIKCLDTGKWEEKPVCKPVTCPPLPGANSSCIKTTAFYESGSLYILTCLDDSTKVSVTRIGEAKMDTACQNNNWTRKDTACYCDCLMNTSASYIIMTNLAKSKFLKHNDTLSWDCSGGATKATDDAVICMDGRLSAEPVCTPPPVTTTSQYVTTREDFTTEVPVGLHYQNDELRDSVTILIIALLVSIVFCALLMVVICLYRICYLVMQRIRFGCNSETSGTSNNETMACLLKELSYKKDTAVQTQPLFNNDRSIFTSDDQENAEQVSRISVTPEPSVTSTVATAHDLSEDDLSESEYLTCEDEEACPSTTNTEKSMSTSDSRNSLLDSRRKRRRRRSKTSGRFSDTSIHTDV